MHYTQVVHIDIANDTVNRAGFFFKIWKLWMAMIICIICMFKQNETNIQNSFVSSWKSFFSADYKKDEDPTLFCSEKTGRGPLSGSWRVGSLSLSLTFLKYCAFIFKWRVGSLSQISAILFPAINHLFLLSENCWSSNDSLQVGHDPIQMVRTTIPVSKCCKLLLHLEWWNAKLLQH